MIIDYQDLRMIDYNEIDYLHSGLIIDYIPAMNTYSGAFARWEWQTTASEEGFYPTTMIRITLCDQ